MQKIRLDLKKRSYDIVIGKGILKRLGSLTRSLDLGADAYVITNPFLKKRFGRALEKALKSAGYSVRFKTVPDAEKSKSIGIALKVLKDLAAYDRQKRVFIVAFGGGVIGDLAGFIASVYKRGIPYIQIPTTLLAQLDSAIGGKTGIDLPEGKNLVGTFYQPRIVLSDIALLSSLDLRQLRNGLAEAVKYGAIKDAALFSYLEKNYRKVLAREPLTLEHVVGCASRIKAGIVSADEREEKGLRTVLNFGHTIGHAIEAAARFKSYNHGEAIALGMLVAAAISLRLKLTERNTLERLEGLIRRIGLPERIRKLTLKGIISAHYRDKKFIGKSNRLVLLSAIGRTKIARDIPLRVIKEEIKKRS
ncbi:MAG: 3-dehydroquinate synthase [Candidatus Omnitrophica bacterium]|nr:3-dehydroquinate synthase [Candidatus Omnitrophota bacterium]